MQTFVSSPKLIKISQKCNKVVYYQRIQMSSVYSIVGLTRKFLQPNEFSDFQKFVFFPIYSWFFSISIVKFILNCFYFNTYATRNECTHRNRSVFPPENMYRKINILNRVNSASSRN